jgi:hypothetical protein
MTDYLPGGLRGLLLASFAAAYMSTIATQMNWGASYLVNDFYRRFVRRDAAERHYVLVSRLATLLTVLLSVVVTYFMTRITQGWELLLSIGAGTGLVYILRWYWWRINAWSEVAAMVAAFALSMALRWVPGFEAGTPLGFARTMLVTVAGTTAIWLVATFSTPPEPRATLLAFYRRVRPPGPGWRAVAREVGVADPRGGLARPFLSWLAGIVVVYATLFGLGELLFGTWRGVARDFAIAVAAAALLVWKGSLGAEPAARPAAGEARRV